MSEEDKIRNLENDIMLIRDGSSIPARTIEDALTDHDKDAHDALALDHGSLGGRADADHDHGTSLAGLADDDHTQYLTTGRHDSTTRHPVSVIKFSTGSYSEDIPISSNGTPFVTNKYGHQIEFKGESTSVKAGGSTAFNSYAVSTDWVARRYYMYNTHGSSAQMAYAQWSYHSASQQAIWGIWDKDEKKLVCVLVEEDEGYCKLYPVLKENQKLIKIKNPEKHKGLFAWDIMKLSKEKQIKEEELEEIKGGK